MKSNFFLFRSKLVTTTFQAHALNLKDGKNGIDAHWNLVKGEYEGIQFPVIFQHDLGKKFRDILDTGWPALYLISEYMIDLLTKNKITGWKTFDIKLFDKKQNEIFGYKGFSITGRCEVLKYDTSSIIEKRVVPTGPICQFYKGVIVEGWDGSDFFTPKETYHITITKKTAEILKAGKISNIQLENCSDDENVIRILEQ